MDDRLLWAQEGSCEGGRQSIPRAPGGWEAPASGGPGVGWAGPHTPSLQSLHHTLGVNQRPGPTSGL